MQKFDGNVHTSDTSGHFISTLFYPFKNLFEKISGFAEPDERAQVLYKNNLKVKVSGNTVSIDPLSLLADEGYTKEAKEFREKTQNIAK